MQKTDWTVVVMLDELPAHIPLPRQFDMHLHVPFDFEPVPGDPRVVMLTLDLAELQVTAPDLFGAEVMAFDEFRRRLSMIVDGPEGTIYKVKRWFLGADSVETLVECPTLDMAIEGCEYQEASLRERFDYIVVRAGNEWLATATREGERSYVFWISQELPG